METNIKTIKGGKMKEVDFVTEYWDWAKRKGHKAEETENRDLLNQFYHTEFHKKHPNYEVNGLEYFQALGKV